MNGGDYQAVELRGDAVRALSMAERMTLSNMSAELGAQTGLIAPDETTRQWLLAHGTSLNEEEVAQWGHWHSDAGAPADIRQFDAAALVPQVAAPHSPANARAIGEYEPVPIDVAYIGACTGAKLDDLTAAAKVLRGRKVARGVQLMVAPASQHDQAEAERLGHMQTLREAGATVVSTTARNFRGRMGSATEQVYLASPYTVAAALVHLGVAAVVAPSGVPARHGAGRRTVARAEKPLGQGGR